MVLGSSVCWYWKAPLTRIRGEVIFMLWFPAVSQLVAGLLSFSMIVEESL